VRFYLRATASLCCTVPLILYGAAQAPSHTPAPHATPPPAPSVPTATTPAADTFAAEAAARHIRRTACLKQAKAKKLLGTARNDYIKDCVAH
jgi:hypothetical protein